ncbi:MAG: hypothetical protein AAGI53_03400 [Planctomycetota bacterium]
MNVTPAHASPAIRNADNAEEVLRRTGSMIDDSAIGRAEIRFGFPNTSIPSTTTTDAKDAVIASLGEVTIIEMRALVGSADTTGLVTVEASLAALAELEEHLERSGPALVDADWKFTWLKKGEYAITQLIEVRRNRV